jgi:hypothetical protein
MATTRKPAARKTTARTVAAKPAATVKKTVKSAPKPAARKVKPTAKKVATAPAAQFVETVTSAGEAANDRLADAAEFARRLADTTVGVPFVAQERLADVNFDSVKRYNGLDLSRFDVTKFNVKKLDLPKIDFAPVKDFFADAEKVGHERIADLQEQIEHLTAPVAKRIDASVNMVSEKLEAQVPEQVREFVSENAKRVRKLVAA